MYKNASLGFSSARESHCFELQTESRTAFNPYTILSICQKSAHLDSEEEELSRHKIDRLHWCEDGFDNPVNPLKEGTDGFGWLINSFILPAQQLWWDTMITRPELGRFWRKIEAAGKIRLFAIANPILQGLLQP
ncbi:hypothetical protein Scep_031071 [Stephania cephalantha]|uniref:Uncharacterized protein n=1 Tax=Stephania cephalantha TaxID=152367 RepID=A0AAP0DU49_9MAGN